MTNTILITGTSSGLGRATARLFQSKGWNVIATMRTPERETELNELKRTLVTRLDVQDVASIQTAGLPHHNGEQVMLGLIEAMIDRTADALERIGNDMDAISREIFKKGREKGTRRHATWQH